MATVPPQVAELLPVAVIAGILVVVGLYIYSKMSDKSDRDWEGKSWGERTKNDAKQVINQTGFDGQGKELYIGFQSMGEINKWDTVTMMDDGIMTAADGFYEEEDSDEEDYTKVYRFMVTPSSGVRGFVWNFTDILMDKNMKTTIYIVPEGLIGSEVRNFKVDDSADWMPYGNMMVAFNDAAINAVNFTGLKQALEATMNYFPDFAEEAAERRISHAEKMGENKLLKEQDMNNILDDV